MTDIENLLERPVEVQRQVSDRAAFYLTHRTLIETWSALRDEAAEAIAECLFSLVGPLSEDLRSLEVQDPQVTFHEGKYPAVHLSAGSWRSASEDSPLVVGLEWHRGAIRPNGSLGIYACVIAPLGHSKATTVQPHLPGLAARLSTSLGREWKHELPRWPTYRFVNVADDAWDAADIAKRSREDLLRVWAAASGPINEILC